MSALDVSYAVWKKLALDGPLPTAYQTTQRSNRFYVWAGTVAPLYKALVEGDDHADWSNLFLASSTLVENEDEALAQLTDAKADTSAIKLPTDVSGRRVVLVHDTSSYRLLEQVRDILASIDARLSRIESE